jgi:hypothetical protein
VEDLNTAHQPLPSACLRDIVSWLAQEWLPCSQSLYPLLTEPKLSS